MKRKPLLLLLVLLLAVEAWAQSQEQETINQWNQLLCIAFKVLQIVAVFVAVIVLIYAGMKYMTSAEDPAARKGARDLIIQVLVGLLFVISAAEIVNYLVVGTDIRPFDTACSLNASMTKPVT